MAAFTLSRNARVFIDKEPHRMLKQIEAGHWQLEHERTGRLCEKATTELLEMLRLGTLQYAGDDAKPIHGIPEPLKTAGERTLGYRCVWEAASILNQAIARARLCYVKALISLPKSKPAREKTIAAVAAEQREAALSNDQVPHPLFKVAPSVSTTDRWQGLYIKGGRDQSALLPRTKNRGNRNTRIPVDLIELLEKAIDEVYLQPERPTIRDTRDAAITSAAAANRLRGNDQQLPLPTDRMVVSLLRKRDPIDICVARYGAQYAKHKYRLVLNGNMITEGLRRAEIDHTPMNVLVIDERTFLPLGRPWLTLIVDVAHRVILGYALSFEPPSYLSVMRCLRHAILPKTYLKERYPDLKNDWPCHGLIDTAGLDNGADFESLGLRDFADRFGIDLDYCEVGAPWMKGLIERLQGTINRGVAHGFPGTVFEDLIERGDYKSASKACITLAELHRLIHIWIVDFYHQKVHRTLGISPQASWMQEMQHREIPLPTSAVELDQALAVRFTRTLSHKGIELDHLFYNSPDVLRILAASDGRIEVEVGRPADDVGYIYLNDPISERFIRVPVIQRFAEYANGLTPWQHAQCVRYAAKHHAGRDDVVALADAKHRIRQGFLQAFAKVKGAAKKAAARFLFASDEAQRAAQPKPPETTDQPPADTKPSGDAAKVAPSAQTTVVKPRKLQVEASARRAA